MFKRSLTLALVAISFTFTLAHADWKKDVELLDENLEYDKAYAIVLREYKKAPGDYWTNYWMGNITMNKDKSEASLKKAEEFLIKAKELQPRNPDVHCKYASALGRIGNRTSGLTRRVLQARATASILEALKINNKNTCAVGAIAVGKHYLGMAKQAEEEWLKLIKLDPKDYWAHANYARTLMKLDRNAEAEAQFTKGVAKMKTRHLKPKPTARFYFGMALFYEDFKKFDQSLKWAKEAQKVYPSLFLLKNAITRFTKEKATGQKIENMDIDMF